jgi:hypothetical protein
MRYSHSQPLRRCVAGIDNYDAAVAQQVSADSRGQARIELNFQAGRQGHIEKVNGRRRLAREREQAFGHEDVAADRGKR